jgi:hypothetical protein
VRHLDGSGGSRPEIGAGTDATFAHLDHRISTTMDIYAQFVPEGQKQAVKQLRAFVERSVPHVPLVFQ